MEALVTSSFKALGSIFAPGMLKVFIASLLLSLLALVIFVICMSWLAGFSSHYVTDPSYAKAITWLGRFGALLIAWMLFPGIMPVIVNFFDNHIAGIIEQRDYPGNPAIEPAFWPELKHDLRFSLGAIALNIVVLPLYFVPLINVGVFYVLNGYLLGKEFFVMVARRHRSLEEAKILCKIHGRTVFTAGLLLTVMATIPFANLIAPFWGIAVMTHLYHCLSVTPRMDIFPPVRSNIK